jgi:hypothetical protein
MGAAPSARGGGTHRFTAHLRLVPSLRMVNQYLNYVKFEVFTVGDYEECRLLGCYAVWLL